MLGFDPPTGPTPRPKVGDDADPKAPTRDMGGGGVANTWPVLALARAFPCAGLANVLPTAVVLAPLRLADLELRGTMVDPPTVDLAIGPVTPTRLGRSSTLRKFGGFGPPGLYA